MTVANCYYNYSTKQHVSALLGYHQAYKTVVLLVVVYCEYHSTHSIPRTNTHSYSKHIILISDFIEF